MQEPAELEYLYEPFRASEMETYEVDTKVNNARSEGAELITPVD